jgi:hypothetical protein
MSGMNDGEGQGDRYNGERYNQVTGVQGWFSRMIQRLPIEAIPINTWNRTMATGTE